MRYICAATILLAAGVLCAHLAPRCNAAGAAVPAGGVPGAGEGGIALNLSPDVDLEVFLDYVAKKTGKRFLYDEKFQGKVTLLAPTTISEDALYPLLEAMLEYKGYALEPDESDLVIRVRRANEAAKKPIPFYGAEELASLPDTDTLVKLAYELRYIGADDVAKTVAPLVGSAGQGAIVHLERANVLIITDYARNLRQVVRVIEMVDTEANVPTHEIVFLEYASAETLARQLARVLAAQAKILGIAEGKGPSVDFDSSSNSLIIVATPRDMANIRELVESLDIEPSETGRSIKIITLKNAKAEDVEKTLRNLFVGGAPSGVRVVPGARAAARGRSGEFGATGTLRGVEVKVVAHEATNQMIVVGPPEVQAEIMALVESLDRRQPQVFIEALVVQVSVGDDTDVGIELASWGGESEHGGIGVTSFGFSTYDYETGERVISEGLGLTGAVINNEEIPVLLRALLVEDDGKILSRPRILANNNAEAVFNSVDREPYTTLSTLTSDTATSSFGDYAEAGTKFSITPQISEGDYLRLKIALEISQFKGVAPSAEVPPAQRSDTVETEVTVPDQYTIVIGGLRGYQISETVSKVPLLGDIPLLGALFRRTRTIRDDTTEYIFIKARIARDEDFADLKGISDESREKSRRIEERIPATGEEAEEESDG